MTGRLIARPASAPKRAGGDHRHRAHGQATAATPRWSRDRRASVRGLGNRRAPAGAARRGRDERGDYALFIAVIASVLLLFGGMAYDGPRLMAARQDALHAANEAARVAAATVASGGTLTQARQAVQDRLDATGLIYGETVTIDSLDCVGNRVQVSVSTGYVFRSAIAVARARQPIEAVGAAEARLVLPNDEISTLHYLGECPLT